jgi:hypothetical protein
MTFSYDASLGTDTDLVRFHIGDTNEEGYFLENETIDYWVAQTSMEEAVITCIRFIITQLSAPDFKQDWLTVNHKEARKGYEDMLIAKAQELGVNATGISFASSVSNPSRADSDQEDNTYDGAI